MFKSFFLFELRLHFERLSTYFVFALFFFLGFMAIYRGVYGSGILPRLAGTGIGNIAVNPPFAIYYLITYLTNFALIFTLAYISGAAFRDFRNRRTHTLFFLSHLESELYFWPV